MASRTEKGRKISEAKTGVRQVELAEGETLLTEAVKEKIATHKELREGVSSGPDGPVSPENQKSRPWLRHRTQPVPGGREATIFRLADLLEDLAAWHEATGGSPKERAAKALRARERDRMRARGAAQLKEAVAVVDPDLDLDTVRRWVKRTEPESVVRGPRDDYWVPDQEAFEAELEQWRCPVPDCSAFALLSTSGRCRVHDAYVDRGGRVTAEEFAEKHHIDAPSLLARLESGEIPGERIDRGGRPGGWLIDEEEALPVLEEHFRCRTDGCRRFALGLNSRGHCVLHAGGAASASRAEGKKMVECANCGSRHWAYPSQLREGPLCRKCNLQSEEFDRLRREAVAAVWADRYAAIAARKSEGLVATRALGAEFGLAVTRGSFISKLDIAHERQTVRGTEFILVDLDEATRRRRGQLRKADGRVHAAQDLEKEIARLRTLGVLQTLDQLQELEARFEVRRHWLTRLSEGPPRADDMRARLVETGREVIRDTPPDQLFELSVRDLRLLTALDDWQDYRSSWSRYGADPRDPEGMDPALYRAAEDRVRKLVGPKLRALLEEAKALQTQRK